MKKIKYVVLILFVLPAYLAISYLWQEYKNDKLTRNIMSEMSLKQKTGQLFMIGNLGKNIVSEELYTKYHFGNIFLGYVDINHLNAFEINALTGKLQKIASKSNNNVPLLIATDQEGGRVNRVKNGVIRYPSQQKTGLIEDISKVEDIAYRTAYQLNAIGINTNFSPVIDVNTNKKSHIAKHKRAFSDDPVKVSKYAEAYLKGYKKGGIIGCVKHFPGYGDVSPDPHKNLPTSRKTLKELYECELIPYLNLKNKADMVMTAHINVPAITQSLLKPATISEEIMKKLLRDEIGFDGVIITDDFNMGAMGKERGIENLAVECINSSVDIILLVGKPKLQKKLYTHILNSVKNGNIPKNVFDSSVYRVIRLKVDYGLFDKQPVKHDELKRRLDSITKAEALKKE